MTLLRDELLGGEKRKKIPYVSQSTTRTIPYSSEFTPIPLKITSALRYVVGRGEDREPRPVGIDQVALVLREVWYGSVG